MHENRLARREPAALEHVRPHGEKRLGDRRGVDQVDATRHGQALRSGGGAVLGVASARHQGADAIADVPVVNLGADRFDVARDLETGNVRRPRRWRILSLPLHQVGPIHAGRRHFDQDIAVADGWQRPFHRRQHLGPARFSNRNGNHGHDTQTAGRGI